MKQMGYTEPFNLVEHKEGVTRKKNWLLLAALCCFMVIGLVTASDLGKLAPTFNGKVNVAELAQNPDNYNLDEADGAAYVVVSKNLAETNAQNVCFSVVFNFRGYDTMGESFILIASLAGSLCILRKPQAGKKKKQEAEK